MSELNENAPAGQAGGTESKGQDQEQYSTTTAVQKLCSGYGQWHSPNNAKNPKPYTTVTLDEIRAMLVEPSSVAKDQAQWVIPSTTLTRVHEEQRKNGEFWALWAETDEPGEIAFQDFVSRTGSALGYDFLAYTTRGAKPDKHKARGIVPLAEPVSGHVFVFLQKILNDKLEAAGITPDRASERAGQVCYLPNRGEYYEYHEETGNGLLSDAAWSDELMAEAQRDHEEQQHREQAKAEARQRAAQRTQSGQQSPMDAWNEAVPVETALYMYGYERPNRRQQWLSPNSSSGVPGVKISDDGMKWISAHDSDAEIGRPCPSGNGVWGDSFDLFVHYEHGGDRDAALAAAGDQFITSDGQTITEANRDAYRQNQPEADVSHLFNDETGSQPTQGDSSPLTGLDQFALNGMAATMEAQMLEDRYILGNLAILGQSTVFYAKPNAGKTLLTIWLLIEAIKAGEINGEDVFYINADDNHKGLTEKLKLAERHGFRMMAPGYPRENPFKPPMLSGLLQWLIKNEKAHGKVLILDTVKKFTDLMKKDKASEFGDAVRQFVSHGGSVIMLAHVNKHRGEDGELIYSGTSDLVDDADCAHTLDILTDDEFEGTRRVKFTNFKNRGDVALEAVYSYDAGAKVRYLDRLESVQAVSDEEREQAEKERQKQEMLERNRDAVEAIRASLRDGVCKRTELIKDAQERSGVGRKQVIRALHDHTGTNALDYQYWNYTVGENNAHIYTLNWPG